MSRLEHSHPVAAGSVANAQAKGTFANIDFGSAILDLAFANATYGQASAAYLKFLHHKRRILFRNFK
jgi:hypothetical protein